MKIIPVCYDSMGTRSTCTLILTPKLNILIDPGLAIATTRLGFPPSNIELNTFYLFKQKILEFSKKADVIIISNYHYDHYISSQDEIFEKLYNNKIILCKNRKTKLDFKQRLKGKSFEIDVKRICKEFHFIDDNEFNFNNVKIKFSQPILENNNRTNNQYVIISSIESKGNKLVYAGNVVGPISEEVNEYIIKENPNTLILSGPPTHLINYQFAANNISLIEKNIKKISQKCKKLKNIIYDHQILRDKNYLKYYLPLQKIAKKYKKKLLTAAKFIKIPIKQLEANRQELFEKET